MDKICEQSYLFFYLFSTKIKNFYSYCKRKKEYLIERRWKKNAMFPTEDVSTLVGAFFFIKDHQLNEMSFVRGKYL